jgi:predicted methyltransferase
MNIAKTAANITAHYITAHPIQTALHVSNAVIFAAPGIVTVPAFAVLGFTPLGPAAGQAASGFMAYFGTVAPGGVYATMQSAAMGGYGASLVAGATQFGAVASSAVGYLWSKKAG